jgi:hypothetical protein
MSVPATAWRIVSSLARTAFAIAWQVFFPSYAIEIVAKDARRLVLKHKGREIVADARYRTVKSGSRVLATFDAIQSIGIRTHRGDDTPDFWEISLRLGPFSRIVIGRTSDDADASIIAAGLGTVTGKPVIEL